MQSKPEMLLFAFKKDGKILIEVKDDGRILLRGKMIGMDKELGKALVQNAQEMHGKRKIQLERINMAITSFPIAERQRFTQLMAEIVKATS